MEYFKKDFFFLHTWHSLLSQHQLKERFKARFITLEKRGWGRGGVEGWKKKGLTERDDFFKIHLTCWRDSEYLGIIRAASASFVEPHLLHLFPSLLFIPFN